jgi:hypothetical protein
MATGLHGFAQSRRLTDERLLPKRPSAQAKCRSRGLAIVDEA